MQDSAVQTAQGQETDMLEVTLTAVIPWSETASRIPLETLFQEWLAGRATLASKKLSASSPSGLSELARRDSGAQNARVATVR